MKSDTKEGQQEGAREPEIDGSAGGQEGRAFELSHRCYLRGGRGRPEASTTLTRVPKRHAVRTPDASGLLWEGILGENSLRTAAPGVLEEFKAKSV